MGVEKWTVFGGSWGSTLATHAIRHPGTRQRHILRGVFLLTERELRWFYQDGASMLFPDAWARFIADPGHRTRRPDGLPPARLIADRQVQAQATSAWSQWKGDTLSLRGPQARPAKFSEWISPSPSHLECHFFVNKGFFLEDGWLLNNIAAVRGIPGWIVQGRFDVVTPLESAWALKQAWPEAHFEIIWDAGHASTEPGIVDALVRATDQALL